MLKGVMKLLVILILCYHQHFKKDILYISYADSYSIIRPENDLKINFIHSPKKRLTFVLMRVIMKKYLMSIKEKEHIARN